ncbi:hypothetical protein QAD02_017331 [Eretmocerus hayati]|uniref:Uncharacterized protein n=1 Tax=Eretmocerus hayati TaxID=131215 RepID=A0ACC2PDZ1_9HYME|nr:hypothetical protein QAD02_017331 [Eretmocerus hayati]
MESPACPVSAYIQFLHRLQAVNLSSSVLKNLPNPRVTRNRCIPALLSTLIHSTAAELGEPSVCNIRVACSVGFDRRIAGESEARKTPGGTVNFDCPCMSAPAPAKQSYKINFLALLTSCCLQNCQCLLAGRALHACDTISLLQPQIGRDSTLCLVLNYSKAVPGFLREHIVQSLNRIKYDWIWWGVLGHWMTWQTMDLGSLNWLWIGS